MSRDVTEIPPLAADERIAYGDDPNQFFDVWRPAGAGSRGALVIIHGGFWRARYDLTHASHLSAAFARQGFNVASLEYRRVGNSGGGWPGTFQDVVAGYSAAHSYFSLQQCVPIGHSAGGHLALRLASEKLPIAGVVALAPVADLRIAHELNLSNDAVTEFLGVTPESNPSICDAACPSRHPSEVRRILIHGTADDVVPIQLSIKFAQLRGMDRGTVTLNAIPGADHFALIDPESATWPEILGAVEELLP